MIDVKIRAFILCCFIVTPALAAPQRERAMPTQTMDVPELAAQDLAVWRDPAFQQRFRESYIAETEIEPRVTSEERDAMLKILEHLAKTPPEMEKALALINKHRAGSAVFDFTLANMHYQQERWDEAVSAYASAVNKYPKFRRAWKNLSLIHIRQSNFKEALIGLRKVIEFGGGDSDTYGLLGYAYSNQENHLAAESAYRMANMLDPDTKDWKLGLARCFFKQERYADAVALTTQMIEEEPQRADLWMLQANAYIGLNQPMRAAENYELIDRLGQSTPDTLNMLGDIYINEELFELAVSNYIRAMELDKEARPARALRAARVLAARGELIETRTLVAQIEALHGERLDEAERKEMLKLQARMAAAVEATDEEARILEQIVTLDPLDGEAIILLGQHSARTGDHEQAIFYFERAASIPRTEADAKVRHAQLLVQLERYAEALPLLRSAQQLRPRDSVQQFLEAVERAAKSKST